MSLSRLTDGKAWSWQAYLDWEGEQPLKYELVDGEIHAMTGGTTSHDIIANNVRATLRQHLRGTPCRLQGPDLKLRAGDNARYPDALVDCGPIVRGANVATEPVIVIEILSRSTAWVDQNLKLRDYDRVPSIRTYVLIAQDEPRILVYRRDTGGRLSPAEMLLIENLDATLDLPEIAGSIPLATIYEDVEFDQA